MKRETILQSVLFVMALLFLGCRDNEGNGENGPPLCEDGDKDGYFFCNAECTPPSVPGLCGDCNDGDPAINPEALEACNGIDDDCDGNTDEDYDADADGYSTCGGDCDDANATINPGALETPCDGVDQNCDNFDSTVTSLAIADVSFLGEADLDEAGFSTNTAGDVNGDGYDDVMIGAPNNDNGGEGSGSVYLFYGPVPAGQVELSGADALFVGPSSHSWTGEDEASPGDVNGDGYADILLGALGYDFQTGRGFLIYGPVSGDYYLGEDVADATFIGERPGDHAAEALAPGGDVNGDGYADILLGAHFNDDGGLDAGKAYLIYGPAYGEMDLAEADASFTGETPQDNAGYSVAIAGDVNADGYDDILIGRWSEAEDPQVGRVYLFYGPVSGEMSVTQADAFFYEENAGDDAGVSVSGAGDVNGDGYGDVLIGARNNPSKGEQSGKVYLIYGPVQGDFYLANADASIISEGIYEQLGRTVSNAGDINADGYGDIIFVAPANPEGGFRAGSAYVFYGPLYGEYDASNAPGTFVGDGEGSMTRYAATAGDVNADGFGDVLVGSYAHDNNPPSPGEGEAYLLYGPTFRCE